MFFLYLLILLIVVELITLIHETGHFLVAKKNGVRVAEFSIGFGPSIFQIKRGTTTYSFRWLPFGGYVSVLSDDVVKELEKIREKNPSPLEEKMIEKKTGGIKLNEDFSKQKTIDKLKTSKKVFFATAGVIFNFVSIFIILLVGYSYIGKGFSTDQIFIKFYNESTNSADNFYLFDNITQVGNFDFEKISGYDDMSSFLRNPDNDKWNVEYQTLNESSEVGYAILDIQVDVYNYDDDKFYYDEDAYFITFDDFFSERITVPDIGTITISGDENQGYLILPYEIDNTTGNSIYALASFNNDYPYYIEYEQSIPLTGWELLKYSFIDTFKVFWLSIIWLISFITLGTVNLGYHPTTTNLSQTAVFSSLVVFFFRITVIFSALMIIFNMLPIPPLDGWRTYEYAYEGVKKKKISKKATSRAMWAGWMLILILFILGIII